MKNKATRKGAGEKNCSDEEGSAAYPGRIQRHNTLSQRSGALRRRSSSTRRRSARRKSCACPGPTASSAMPRSR